MTYQCEKGCRDPKAKDGREWHRSQNECPYEEYRATSPAGRPGKMRAKGHPQPSAAPAQQVPAQAAAAPRVTESAPVSRPAASGGVIMFSDRKADVVKGTSGPAPGVVADYVVDWPHTEALWNFGFRVLYFIHVKVDEWAFDWHKHLPREQFKLSENAKAAAEVDERNLYSRGATWFCRSVIRCPDQKSAHSAIDSIVFFEAFGGIFVALVFHYEEVYKKSPKMIRKREEARARAARRRGAIETTGREVPQPAAEAAA